MRRPRLSKGQIARHSTMSMMLNWIKFRRGQPRDPFPATHQPLPPPLSIRTTAIQAHMWTAYAYTCEKRIAGGRGVAGPAWPGPVDVLWHICDMSRDIEKIWLPAGLIRRVFESCGSETGPPAPFSSGPYRRLRLRRTVPVSRATTLAKIDFAVVHWCVSRLISRSISRTTHRIQIIFEFYTSERSVAENSHRSYQRDWKISFNCKGKS